MPERRVRSGRDPVRSTLLLAAQVAHGARARAWRTSADAARGSCSSASIGLLFWAFIFGVLYRLLVVLPRRARDRPAARRQAARARSSSAFFSILLLSNVITALSSFFLARDLDLLVAAPVDWLQALRREAARDARATRAGWSCSWRCRCSRRTASVYDGGLAVHPLRRARRFVPFLIIPAVIGSASRWCS